MSEFIIIHDTEKYEGCLYCLAGCTLESAQARLDQIINHPTRQENEAFKKGYTNFRIKEVKSEDCWWNEGSLD